MQRSIRTRLVVAFVALATIPLILVGAVLTWRNLETQQQQALAMQREVARGAAAQVAAFIQDRESEMRILIQVRGLQDLSYDQLNSVLSQLLSVQRAFDQVALLNREGREMGRVSRHELFTEADLADRSQSPEFMLSASSRETYYGPVWFDPRNGQPLMTIAVPAWNARTGQTDGVLVANVRISQAWDVITNVRVGKQGFAYIVDSRGAVVAHRDVSVVLRHTIFIPPGEDGVYTGLYGTRAVLAEADVQLGQRILRVVAELPMSEALAPTYTSLAIAGALILVVIGIAGSAGSFAVSQIVRPIEALAQMARVIQAGDLSRRVTVTRHDEIGNLAKAFNSMTDQLQQTLAGLEQRVAERTREVEKRAGQITAAAEVSRAASQVLDPDELLRQVVELICKRFDLYYAAAFLVDANGEQAVLRAGTGEAGELMLGHGHKLPVGETSMVGWACAHKEARIALDVGREAVRFANPLLPLTRSEMALPLRVGDRVIGALDIQSTVAQAFDEDSITALQGMADQVAVALENARLFQQVRSSLKEVERFNRLLTRQGWETFLRSTGTGFEQRFFAEFHQPNVPALTPDDIEQRMVEGLARGPRGSSGRENTVCIPLRVRRQVIGTLVVERDAGQSEWSATDLGMLEEMAAQAAQALESARLFEDAGRTAARERLVNEITSRIHAASTVPGILQTAARELAAALNVPHAVARIELKNSG
jgi:GAF domain-containing protein/HAMP domain-containing protein